MNAELEEVKGHWCVVYRGYGRTFTFPLVIGPSRLCDLPLLANWFNGAEVEICGSQARVVQRSGCFVGEIDAAVPVEGIP